MARVGLEEATARLVISSLLTPNDAASVEGSTGLKHEWHPAVDEGVGIKWAGGCIACLLNDNARISLVCTSIARATPMIVSVIISVFSGRPEYKQ